MIKRFFINSLSLSILQAINGLSGVIAIPMLISKLGIELFGVYSVQLSVVMYLLVLIDYGFNFISVNKISIAKEKGNIADLKVVYITTLVARFGIATLVSVIYSVFIMCSNMDIGFVLFSIYLIGYSMIASFYFQAIEEMWYISVITLFGRCFYIFLLWFMSQGNITEAVFYASVSYFVSGVISFFIINRKIKFSLRDISIVSMLDLFRSSTGLFFASFGVSLYRYVTIPLLSVFSGSLVVGVYSALEKIYRGVQGVLNSFTQAAYPIICAKNEGIYRSISFFIIVFSFFVYFCSFIFIVSYPGLFKLDNTDLFFRLNEVFVCSFFVGSINFMIAVLRLIPTGHKGIFTRSVIISGSLTVICSIVLGHFFGGEAVIYALPMAELLCLIMMSIFFIKKRMSYV